MVEGEHHVVKGEMKVVGHPRRRRLTALEPPTELVVHRADGAALERRQAGGWIEGIAVQARAQRVERRTGQDVAVPTWRALSVDDEATERIGADVGIAPERVPAHGAIEHREAGQDGEPSRRSDRLHPAQPPGPHRPVPSGRALGLPMRT